MIKLSEDLDNSQKSHLDSQLRKINNEASDALKAFQNMNNPKESYNVLDYLIKDATELRKWIERNKII